MMENFEIDKMGKFIALKRKEKKLTQSQLAELLGVSSFKTISKWENGYLAPDISYINSLCRVLEVDFDELISGGTNSIKKINNKRINHKILIIIVTMLVCFFSSLIIMFIMHKNNKAYKIQESSFDSSIVVEGFIYQQGNKCNVSLNLDTLSIDKDNFVQIDLYSGKNLIYHSNSSNVGFSILKSKINLHDLKMFIGYLESNYVIDINPVVFSDVVRDDYMVNSGYSDDKISVALNKLHFSESNKGRFYVVKKPNYTIELTYFNDMFNPRFIYRECGKDTNYVIIYNWKLNSYDAYTYKVNGKEEIILEKFSYDFKNQKIDCQKGACKSYEIIQDIAEKIATLQFGELVL